MRTLRIIGVLGTTALVLSASVAFAEERPKNTAPRPAVTGESRTKVATTTWAEMKQAAKERMEATREEAKTRVKAVREEAKERMTEKREKASKRLADIQDKTKRQMAEKVARQLEKLNATWTDHFMDLLNRYDEVVEKMQDRANAAAGKGKEVTVANATIELARVAIENTRTAVTAQAAKVYTLDATVVTVSTSTTTPDGQGELMQGLRKAFQEVHRTLFADLFALRDGPMKNVRRAVQDALQALGKVPKVDDNDDDETATSTAASNQ